MYSNQSDFSNNLIQLENSRKFNECDVVVVGGGCSGLECARELYALGFTNLVVLEAQDYIGGRIKTTYINNDERYPLEAGACWIHGLVVKTFNLESI